MKLNELMKRIKCYFTTVAYYINEVNPILPEPQMNGNGSLAILLSSLVKNGYRSYKWYRFDYKV